MNVRCPYCEASLDVESKITRLRCGECLGEFPVRGKNEVLCPNCDAVLKVPAGTSVLLCGRCKQRIELDSPKPPPVSEPPPPSPPPPQAPERKSQAHQETSLIEGPTNYQQQRLEVTRAEFAEKYDVLEVLGQGGMGAIYKAKQKQPPRLVVLKLMLNGKFASEKYRIRFEREAQAVARLKHPGIVSVYEYGEVRGQPYFTMEYVEGCSVKEYVLRHNMEKRQICELMVNICKAVAYAHQRGVIHRDIKPNNILVDGAGNPRLLDFGLARLAGEHDDDRPHMSETGEVMGTPSYMSPEQTLGRPEELDIRSDVYSIGVLFYELLTDTLPYRIDRTRPLESLRVIRELVPKRPSVINPKIDGDLESIVMKCLEKERDLRYQSAVELVEDIGRYLRGQPVEARPSTTFYHFRKLLWRHRSVFLPIGAGILIVLGVTAFFVWQLKVSTKRAQVSVRQANQTAQDAAAKQQALVEFISELKGVRRRIETLLAEEQWEDAYHIASFAEQNLPRDAGLKGIAEEVKAKISTATAGEADKVARLIEMMRFQDARERIEQMKSLADRLNLPDLRSRMAGLFDKFDESCWQSLFSYMQINGGSARGLQAFVTECPGNSHASEARNLLQNLILSVRFTQWPFGEEEARRQQKETANKLDLPVTASVELEGETTLPLVLVPGGEFIMGASGEGKVASSDQQPVHHVRVRHPLYMSATEITREQYERVTGRVLSAGDKGERDGDWGKMPAAVTWDEAQFFCRKLSLAHPGGIAVRLPTEAEWEHACRAGTDAAYSFGPDPDGELAPLSAWYARNAAGCPHPVGQKAPNAWGLYDMHGNMLEWCQDWYDARYYLSAPVQDPQGPDSGSYKVLRGGSWDSSPDEMQCPYRTAAQPGTSRPTYGFRICIPVFGEGLESLISLADLKRLTH